MTNSTCCETEPCSCRMKMSETHSFSVKNKAAAFNLRWRALSVLSSTSAIKRSRVREAYTGNEMVPAEREEDAVRSGCAALDIHAIVIGGSTETRGELRCPSTNTRFDSSNAQPSNIRSCTVTGNGEDSSLRRCGSNVETKCKLSIEMDSLLAASCRRAFRKTSGRRKSLKATGWARMDRDCTRRTQSPFSAAMRLANPCK
mmetsp:Transcript_19818/g.37291  ORF Transcript_19818/g.37291 Transcript_19818/m.37291 type:complete len:201 (-) Transcript_19818:97-699(-)